MQQHKFNVGRGVRFFPPASGPFKSPEGYKVTRLLPAEYCGFQIRINGVAKGLGRIVTESKIG